MGIHRHRYKCEVGDTAHATASAFDVLRSSALMMDTATVRGLEVSEKTDEAAKKLGLPRWRRVRAAGVLAVLEAGWLHSICYFN
jgi:hypothetical protein